MKQTTYLLLVFFSLVFSIKSYAGTPRYLLLKGEVQVTESWDRAIKGSELQNNKDRVRQNLTQQCADLNGQLGKKFELITRSRCTEVDIRRYACDYYVIPCFF